MLTRALIEQEGNGKMSVESRDLLVELPHRGVPVTLFTRKKLERRQLEIDRTTLVAGYVPTVLLALKQLGIEPPPTNDYPECLLSHLHRRIWPSTVGRVKESLFEGTQRACFVKPKDRKKRFTGQVMAAASDLIHLEGASNQTPVWCSEVVDWRTEYRVYIVQGRVVGMDHYEGDASIKLDPGVVEDAVQRLESSGEATAGYSLDFGVLGAETTALIEWNDGYALGSYGLAPAAYTDLILSRWSQLVSDMLAEE